MGNLLSDGVFIKEIESEAVNMFEVKQAGYK